MVILLVVYTSLVLPVRTAFQWADEVKLNDDGTVDGSPDGWTIMDIAIDFAFLFDVILNFNTGYIREPDFVRTFTPYLHCIAFPCCPAPPLSTGPVCNFRRCTGCAALTLLFPINAPGCHHEQDPYRLSLLEGVVHFRYSIVPAARSHYHAAEQHCYEAPSSPPPHTHFPPYQSSPSFPGGTNGPVTPISRAFLYPT